MLLPIDEIVIEEAGGWILPKEPAKINDPTDARSKQPPNVYSASPYG